MVDKIESGILTGKYTLGISLDVSGAFDNLSIKAIIEGLTKKNVPKYIIKWYEYYLRNRRAVANIQGSKVTRLLTKGTPQGGVFSSSAWNMGIDDIIEEANKGGAATVAYADDIFILITGIDPDTLVDLAQPIIDNITKMGLEKGLVFNPSKTVAVMFTNKKTKGKKYPRVNDTQINFSKGMKYLGIYIDEHISFTKHITDKIDRCKKHLYALNNIVGKKGEQTQN